MKNVAYISIISSTFYFALFVTVPLWNFFLAWPVALYCLTEIVIALTILSKKSDIEDDRIKLSKDEVEAIKFCKDNNLELDKMLGTSVALHQTAINMSIEDDYKVIFVPGSKKELLDKIYLLINDQESLEKD